MSQLLAGNQYDLTVYNTNEYGYTLKEGDQEIFLHTKEATSKLKIGQVVKVFLYQDHNGRIAATMAEPLVTLDSFAWLKVVSTRGKLGAFLAMGIQKDILLSRDDLPEKYSHWPKEGDEIYCTLTLDKKGRLFAKMSLEAIEQMAVFAEDEMYNADVSGTVYKISEEGVKLITENRIICFVHESEMNETVRLGQKVTGRITFLKADGTANMSLKPRKQERLQTDAEVIYSYLEHNDGVMPIHDKSSPDLIKSTFNLSKGAYKRAIGTLLKEGKIVQSEGLTKIKSNEE
jgi:uncharacterized protein